MPLSESYKYTFKLRKKNEREKLKNIWNIEYSPSKVFKFILADNKRD